MTRPGIRSAARRLESAFLAIAIGLIAMHIGSGKAQIVTDLSQLTWASAQNEMLVERLDLQVTVCAASQPGLGVLIVQDRSGIELLQIGAGQPEFQPGDRIRIHRDSCLLRRREMGVEISAVPVVQNDGLHAWRGATGEAVLPAGMVPIRLEWFNYWRLSGLGITAAISNAAPRAMAASELWHAESSASGDTDFVPGLRAECFEGTWEAMPNFDLLPPVKTTIATNFDLEVRSRDERIGIRFTGYWAAPQAGRYQFNVWSDDGSLLFLGNPKVSITRLGGTAPPSATLGKLLWPAITNIDERHWTEIEGRVSFVASRGKGLSFDLETDRHRIAVRLADATGLDQSALLNARIRIQGIGRAVISADGSLYLGKLFAVSARHLEFLESALGKGELKRPLSSVAQVQSLPIEEARKALPVRIRGTVTGAINTSREHWMSFQDDTRGIFVPLNAVSNASPRFGELWELEGHSGAGDFAPIVVATKMQRLGESMLPEPVVPTWAELLNGSRDVQWAEITGLVTDVRSNTFLLHLPEGNLQVELEEAIESDLRPYLKALVRIRGVLYAVWDAVSREVRVGRVMMRNSSIGVDVPAPVDPFAAVERTPRELLLFDAQATSFRPVKVRGQITYADATQLYLQAEGAGMRLLAVGTSGVSPGDWVEAVGYPDLGRNELVLREARTRVTGRTALPEPTRLGESELARENLNSTRVRVTGRLLGWQGGESGPVLEMQSGARLFLARVASGKAEPVNLRPGSRLALEGIYVGRGQAAGHSVDNESFELLLNSIADVTILSQPSWWTLPRLLVLSGVLVVILVSTVVWNTQLRRLVEQRTQQLQREIRERERLERQHALESERSRIARDLHDDLGSSLTEISVLASTGQLPQANSTGQAGLFHAIGRRARNLIAALDVIVWAVDPEDNTLQSLADYLTGYTTEFFSHTTVACRFKVPVAFPPITLEGSVRHDLLLAVKEALNNVVRHADATELDFRLAVTSEGLELEIADNGKGIEKGDPARGHGLKNLSARLRKLGGDCRVSRRSLGGTSVCINLPLGLPVGADLARKA